MCRWVMNGSSIDHFDKIVDELGIEPPGFDAVGDVLEVAVGQRGILAHAGNFEHGAGQNILRVGLADRDIELFAQTGNERFEDTPFALQALIEREI